MRAFSPPMAYVNPFTATKTSITHYFQVVFAPTSVYAVSKGFAPLQNLQPFFGRKLLGIRVGTVFFVVVIGLC